MAAAEGSEAAAAPRFSIRAALDETLAIAAALRSAAVPGAVLLLASALLWARLPPEGMGETVGETWRIAAAYWRANGAGMALAFLVAMAGHLVFMRGLLSPEGGAKDAVAGGLRGLPAYLAASILALILFAAGFVLLLIPALYLVGRLTPLIAVAACEPPRNPLDALLRTLDLTRGNGWRIFFYLLAITLPLYVASSLLSPPGLAGGFFEWALQIPAFLLEAGLYRHLRAAYRDAVPTTGT